MAHHYERRGLPAVVAGQKQEPPMTKLLLAYRAAPTLKNAQKLRAYERAHPMSRCMLTVEDGNLLADAIHQANQEG
jgi:hypothetical protein